MLKQKWQHIDRVFIKSSKTYSLLRVWIWPTNLHSQRVFFLVLLQLVTQLVLYLCLHFISLPVRRDWDIFPILSQSCFCVPPNTHTPKIPQWIQNPGESCQEGGGKKTLTQNQKHCMQRHKQKKVLVAFCTQKKPQRKKLKNIYCICSLLRRLFFRCPQPRMAYLLLWTYLITLSKNT